MWPHTTMCLFKNKKYKYIRRTLHQIKLWRKFFKKYETDSSAMCLHTTICLFEYISC